MITNSCGFVYIACNIADDAEFFEFLSDEVSSDLDAYCLLLPYLKQNRPFEQRYSIVYHDWQVVLDSGKKGVLPLCKHTFAGDVMG